MKTTMVHVLDLLGCIANGPTTEAALETTPEEIRRYLRFLKKHGEDVDPRAAFKTKIEAHVMEGSWIGYGNPDPGFAPDFEQLTKRLAAKHLKRVSWLGKELGAMARKLSHKELTAKPRAGRPIFEIIRHVADAERSYVSTVLGKVDGSLEAVRAIEAGPDDLPEKIDHLWSLLTSHFESATEAELNQQRKTPSQIKTPRRYLRRMLEHPWEHLREIERRLENRR
jgi:hypothetical protein